MIRSITEGTILKTRRHYRRAKNPGAMSAPGVTQADRSGPLHLAGGRQHGLRGVDLGHQVPAPAGAFLVERIALVLHGAERGDVDRLEELVIVGAHRAFTAVEHFILHALER